MQYGNDRTRYGDASVIPKDRNSVVQLRQDIDDHVVNKDIHITTGDRKKWNDKYGEEEVDEKIREHTNVPGLHVSPADRDRWDNPPTAGPVTETQDGLMIASDKVKLDGIEDGANFYELPETLPASMIVDAFNRRFVTDTLIAYWNGKADAEPDTGWQSVTLLNGHTSPDSAREPMYRVKGATIQLKGVIGQGTSLGDTFPVFQLPADDRPAQTLQTVISAGGNIFTRLTINTDGNVTIALTTTVSEIALDCVLPFV